MIFIYFSITDISTVFNIQPHKKNFSNSINKPFNIEQKLKEANLNTIGLSNKQLMLFDGFKFESKDKFNMLKKRINTLNNINTSQKITDSTLFNSQMAEQYANALKSIDSSQAALILSTQGLTNAQIAQTLAVKEGSTQKAYEAMVNAGVLSSQKTLTAAQFEANLSKTLSTTMSKEEAKSKTNEIMKSMGLALAVDAEGKQFVKLNARKLKALVQSGKLSEAQAMEIAMTNGITFSMQRQTASVMPQWIAKMKVGVAMLKEQAIATAKWLALNPAAWCAVAAAGVIVLNKAINDNIKSLDEQKKQLENTNTKISDNDSEITGLHENMTSNKQQIEQLAGSGNPSDSAKIQALQDENFGYQMQLELLKVINEQEKLNAQQITKDIINNTALITTMQQELDNLKNLDLKGFLGDLPIISGIKDIFGAIKEGFSTEGLKKALSANFKINPATSLLSTLIPHKENDKGIVEETSDQIKSISGLRDELADLEKQRGSMSTDKYLKAEQKIKDKINSESSSLLENITQLQEHQSHLDKSSDEFKNIQNVLDEYTKSLAKLPEYSSFDKILNSEAFGSSKEELVKLAKQGTLTGDTLEQNYHNLYILFDALGIKTDEVIAKLKNMPDSPFSYEKNSEEIDNFQSKVSRLSQALSDIRSGSMDQSGLLDLKQEFSSLDITSDNLDVQIEKLINTLLQNLYTTLGNPPESLKEMLKGIADEAVNSSKSVESLSDSMSSLKSASSLLEDARGMLDSGFDMDTLQSMVSTYGSEMETVVAKYSAGLVGTDAVFAQLEKCYKQDEQNYLKSVQAKIDTDSEYYDSIINDGNFLIKEYADAYGIDYSNWKTMQQAKLESESKLVTQLKGIWGDYLDIVFDEDGIASAAMQAVSYDDDMYAANEAWAQNEAEAKKQVDEELARYNKLRTELNKPLELNTSNSRHESLIAKNSASQESDSSDISDNTDELKEGFDQKLKLLDHYHEMGRIKDEQYYQSLNELNEEYFANQEEYLDDYRSYAEKVYEGLKQSYKDMLDGQLSYMDQTVNAVTAFLDDGIEALNSQKEAVEESYNLRINALENEQKALEEQQKAIEKQKDDIQEQIDAIQKANEARQKAIDLQKKQYELGRAMNQNAKQVYVNGQMVWQTDDAAVVDARNELDSALSDAEADKLQSRIDALDESSVAIDRQKDTIQEQIDSLSEELNQVTAEIDRQIEALQEYCDRWSEIPSRFEETQNSLAAVMMLGQDWQAGVLSVDEAMLVNFGSVYTGLQGQIQSVTDASAMQIAQMAGLTCASMGIMSEYTDEQLGIMSESISDNSIIGSESLAELALSGSTSLSGLADNVGTSSQLTAESLGSIITAANDAREALEKLSSLQESAGLDGIPGLHGFMAASDASAVDSPNGAVPVDITLMKRGGIAGAGHGAALKTSGGVRVPAAGLAKELGEDCLVAVKEGEGFIPPEQVDSIQSFLDRLAEQSSKPYTMPPSYIDTVIKAASGLSTVPNLSQKDALGNNIVFQSGAFNINLNEMRDVSALGEAIVRELPNIVTRKLNPSL